MVIFQGRLQGHASKCSCKWLSFSVVTISKFLIITEFASFDWNPMGHRNMHPKLQKPTHTYSPPTGQVFVFLLGQCLYPIMDCCCSELGPEGAAGLVPGREPGHDHRKAGEVCAHIQGRLLAPQYAQRSTCRNLLPTPALLLSSPNPEMWYQRTLPHGSHLSTQLRERKCTSSPGKALPPPPLFFFFCPP